MNDINLKRRLSQLFIGFCFYSVRKLVFLRHKTIISANQIMNETKLKLNQ